MFDLLAMLLSSVASFLFPIFASYKALKTSDPAQLTPWLMYWVVFSCALLAESWVYFILAWVPFYGYIRLLFFLYLMLPQTQGARVLYEEYVHPFLRDNEGQIDEFIASAHDRLKAAGLAYVRRAIDYLRTQVLGFPPVERDPPTPPPPAPQGYTQALFARFSIPTSSTTSNPGSELYNLLSRAVTAATSAAAHGGPASAQSSSVIPPHLKDSKEQMDFISAQRNQLNILLSALDREAAQLQRGASRSVSRPRTGHESQGEDEETSQRPPSGLSMWSGISKSRSETDFEKIDVDSGAEDDATIRRRAAAAAGGNDSGTWMPWSRHPNSGKTSGRED